MKPILSRMLAWLMACMLLCTPALAAPLDASISDFFDVNTDVCFALSAQLDTLVPYGEEALALFNQTLEHVSVTARVMEGSAEMDLRVAGDPVISLSEKGNQLTTPLLPNRTLISQSSPMDALLAAEKPAFDLFEAIREAESCYRDLTDAILPYAEQKKANYKISGVGASTWSRIARLTPEQGAELAPLITRVLGCGMDEAFREELRQLTFGKGFIVGLYQTKENGDDLAVYMKGSVTLPEGRSRTLSYQWAFATKDDGTRVDTYKFEMTKGREISASYERKDGLLEGESKCLVRGADENVTTTITHDLTGSQNGDERTLEGSIVTAVRTSDGENASTVTTTVSPKLTLLSREGSGVLSGTAAIERKQGKNVHLSAHITFSDEPADRFAEAADTGMLFIVTDDDQPSLMQNMHVRLNGSGDGPALQPPAGYESHPSPASPTTVDLDAISPEAHAQLMEEMAQNLAGKLIIAIAKLPKEDSQLLQDNLSQADFSALLSLVEGL